MKLKEKYTKEIIGLMKTKFAFTNNMATPRVEKVVVNIGLGEAKENPKLIDVVLKDLKTITGQKPLVTKAKKAIAGFKIRAGQNIGLKVTLRDERMYDFLERVSKIALPRIRDFRGLKNKGFDGNGGYSFGIKEHIVFPEIKYDKVEKVTGMQITIKTNAKTNDEAKELLTLLGFPFEKIELKKNKEVK